MYKGHPWVPGAMAPWAVPKMSIFNNLISFSVSVSEIILSTSHLEWSESTSSIQVELCQMEKCCKTPILPGTYAKVWYFSAWIFKITYSLAHKGLKRFKKKFLKNEIMIQSNPDLVTCLVSRDLLTKWGFSLF